jgi:hypothetical protein
MEKIHIFFVNLVSVFWVKYSSPSCLHRFRSVESLLWGAEPIFELGLALQLADALLFVPRCTLG